MLKLYILRHAQAAGGFDIADKDRALTEHGLSQSRAVAKHLGSIDLCLCSSAHRTKMTYDGIIEGGAKIKKVNYLDEIYNAPAGTLLNTIQQAGDAKSILLIAHNPGIHLLANMVTIDDNSTQRAQLLTDYVPATLSIVDCDISDWKKIQPAENKLLNLIIPD